MTNDIRKNIMLIESIILDESFKDAQAKFSASTSSEEVKEYLEKFKELSKRNIIKGQDKDIGAWIKGDWVDFKKFVDSNSTVVTKRQSKVEQKKDSIVVYKDDTKQVVVPLTKEASIQYGKNTAWCTAYTEAKNQFIKYFYVNKVTLFYVLFKDGNKYACAFHPEQADTTECFDKADKSMHFNEFEKATGISKKDIQTWYISNKAKIEDSRNLNNVSEEAQLAIVTQDGGAINSITNPSEAVQLAAVTQNSYAIMHIDNPSETVQLAAVNKNGRAFEYIDNPSEELQLVAVTQFGAAIEYIVDKGIVPSEQVQLAAVKTYGSAIKYIKNPSEELQLAAVTQDGFSIMLIIDKGIVPSEEVQLAAVTQNGYAIEGIIKKGIIPSEEVQIAAVKNRGDAIEYIDNPSEKVQIAAVKKSGFAITLIKNPTEKVKALHKKLWVDKE